MAKPIAALSNSANYLERVEGSFSFDEFSLFISNESLPYIGLFLTSSPVSEITESYI